MFQHEVFGKGQCVRPRPIRLDPGGSGSIRLSHGPERMFALVPASRETAPCIALFGEVHSGSSCPVGCSKPSPPGASLDRLGASRTYLDFSKLNTSGLARAACVVAGLSLVAAVTFSSAGYMRAKSQTLGKAQGTKHQMWCTSDGLP